jgi:short-subunit dehydrogenase
VAALTRQVTIPTIITQLAIENMESFHPNSNAPKGVIINVTSATVTQPISKLAIYAGSKSYLDYFSRATAQSYKKTGIYIVSVR